MNRSCLVNREFKITLSMLLLSMVLIAPIATFANQVIETFEIPANSSGLTWDGEYFWFGGIGPNGNYIRAIDINTGNIVDSIQVPVPDCLGLAHTPQGLIYLSTRSDSVYIVSKVGSTALFKSPYPYLAGVGSEGNDIWAATYYNPQSVLLKLNTDGEIIRSMPFAIRHSRDMTMHRNVIYVADRLTQQIRVINPESGRLIHSFLTPGTNPDGLTTDGEFLWAMDDGEFKDSDRLYKIYVRPEGSVRLSSLYHNFGSVIIDESKAWTVWVYNDGARAIRRVSFESRNGNDNVFTPHIFNFPEIIEPGDSIPLRVTFRPAYSDSVHIEFGLTYDSDRQTYWVQLSGKGVRNNKTVNIRQRNMDFGIARYGEGVRGSNIRYLEFENAGGEPLTLEALNFSSGIFSHGYYDLPHTFDEPGLYRIPIYFRPLSDGNIRGQLTILTDDPNAREIQVNLDGIGRLNTYHGGTVLWQTSLGNRDNSLPRVRSIQPMDDISSDGLADVVIATNDYFVNAYHASASHYATEVWSYTTDTNPWRRGLVTGTQALSEGDDWDQDGIHDIVFGLGDEARRIIALSGRTGEELWTFDTHHMDGGGGAVLTTNAKYDMTGNGVRDVICLVGRNSDYNTTNSIFVLNARNQEVVWQTELEYVPSKIYVINDVTGDGIKDIIIRSSEEMNRIVCVEGRRGNIIWENEFEGDVRSDFSIEDVNNDGSMDYVAVTYMNGIYTFNGSNGILLWQNQSFNRITSGTALNDLNANGTPDIVYGDYNGYLRAIDGRFANAAWDTSLYLGSAINSLGPLSDFTSDGKLDFLAGTFQGRIFAIDGNGRVVLWSYSNVGDGRGFDIVTSSRDLDGNNEDDAFGVTENGTVLCFAGTYIAQVSVDDEESDFLLPVSPLVVDPAFPNPFNSSVLLPITLANSGQYSIRIVDILGREVYNAESAHLPVGQYKFAWQGVNNFGNEVPSGFYLIEVSSNGNRQVRQVQLIR